MCVCVCVRVCVCVFVYCVYMCLCMCEGGVRKVCKSISAWGRGGSNKRGHEKSILKSFFKKKSAEYQISKQDIASITLVQ